MLVNLLSKASTIAMLSFVISSMLAMGAGLTISQIIQPLRNPRLIVLRATCQFRVDAARCALALSNMLQLDEPLRIGLLAARMCGRRSIPAQAGGTCQRQHSICSGNDGALMVVTVGYLPIVLPLLLPGVAVDPAKIARSLSFAHAAPAWHRACRKVALWGIGCTSKARA